MSRSVEPCTVFRGLAIAANCIYVSCLVETSLRGECNVPIQWTHLHVIARSATFFSGYTGPDMTSESYSSLARDACLGMPVRDWCEGPKLVLTMFHEWA